ncbi:MAG: transporter substrate-binding domain-containing protein [Clostridia bacterium]|nr:transporter substrate-binding domain-containing protein [Clostridia bacterium]
MKMKKILAAVMAGVMALSMTACGAQAAKEITSPDDFAGAKISVQTATSAHESIQDLQETIDNIEVLPYEKVTQCFDDLKLSRCDAVYVDSVVAGYYLADADAGYKKVWTNSEGEPIGMCLKKGNTDLEAILEAAIDTLYYNGTMAELSKKHFGSEDDVKDVRTVTEEPVLDLSALKTIQEGKLLVGMEIGYPPMEYMDESGLTPLGFDVDLSYELGKLLGLEVELVNTAWDGIFAGLDKEQYDVIISSVSITPERQEAYELTEPYIANALCIVVKE